jgi:hypothetical protein
VWQLHCLVRLLFRKGLVYADGCAGTLPGATPLYLQCKNRSLAVLTLIA